MTPEIKHDIANTISIAGLGSALMNWETPLTILLILTGIILNIGRIAEMYKNRK